MNIDEKISRSIHETTKKSWALRHLAVFCADDLIWLMIGLGLGTELFDGRGEIYEAFWLISWWGLILFGSWFVTFLIGRQVKRLRPYVKHKYQPLIRPFIETPSFPSAHATFVFALAVFLTIQSPLAAWFLMGAVFVALGRVAVGVHYLSDVFVGAVVGSVVPWALALMIWTIV